MTNSIFQRQTAQGSVIGLNVVITRLRLEIARYNAQMKNAQKDATELLACLRSVEDPSPEVVEEIRLLERLMSGVDLPDIQMPSRITIRPNDPEFCGDEIHTSPHHPGDPNFSRF